jgi:hypothetical protein
MMVLQIRPHGFGIGWAGDWFMVKNSVWRRGQRAGKCRFLCVGCLEHRIGRKLSADDFRRSAKVNFDGEKSAKTLALQQLRQLGVLAILAEILRASPRHKLFTGPALSP